MDRRLIRPSRSVRTRTLALHDDVKSLDGMVEIVHDDLLGRRDQHAASKIDEPLSFVAAIAGGGWLVRHGNPQ